MRNLFHILAFLSSGVCLGQSTSLDSLLTELKKPHKDTTKVWLYLDIGFEYFQQSDSFVFYTEKGLQLANEIGFLEGLKEGNINKGIYYSTKSDFTKSIASFQESYQLATQLEDTVGMIVAINNMGIAHKKKGNYFQAIKCFNEVINYGDSRNAVGTGQALNNLGSVYYKIGDYSKAIDLFLESLEFKKSIGDAGGYFSTNSNIASIYYEMGEYERSVEYYEKALQSDSSMNKMLGLGSLYQGLGMAYEELDDRSKALEYYERSLEVSKKMGNRIVEGNALYHIGSLHNANENTQKGLITLEEAVVFFEKIDSPIEAVKVKTLLAEAFYKLGDYYKAIEISSEALKVAEMFGLKKHIAASSWIIYRSNLALGEHEIALDYLLLHKVYNDSLRAELNKKELLAYENRVELQELQNDNLRLSNRNELNEAMIARNNSRIERQKLLIYGGIIVLILVSGYAYLLFRFIKNKRGSVRLLRQKNAEIQEQALELQKSNIEIKQMNESLENKVKDRTVKIMAQNEKLREYAFSNAHLVRAPLARIMGLVDLLIDPATSEEQRTEFRKNLRSSALELDQIIRKVSDVLSEEEIKDKIT